MQSEETFLTKTFLIADENSGNVVQAEINVPYIPSSRQLNLSRALSSIHTHFANLSNSQIFYFNIHKRMNIYIGQFPFHQEFLVKHELFCDQIIRIQFRKIVSQHSMEQKPCPPQPKKRKVKQRTIKEAMDAVTRWRELYEKTDQNGKRKYTLQSAAQQVGYAKKTLDDYFNQLRQAQYYGFDLKENQNQKIGMLRRFVRVQLQRQKDAVNLIEDDNDEIDKYFKDPHSSDDDDYNFS